VKIVSYLPLTALVQKLNNRALLPCTSIKRDGLYLASAHPGACQSQYPALTSVPTTQSRGTPLSLSFLPSAANFAPTNHYFPISLISHFEPSLHPSVSAPIRDVRESGPRAEFSKVLYTRWESLFPGPLHLASSGR